eukprot:2392040-Amphidinium_carterae.2
MFAISSSPGRTHHVSCHCMQHYSCQTWNTSKANTCVSSRLPYLKSWFAGQDIVKLQDSIGHGPTASDCRLNPGAQNATPKTQIDVATHHLKQQSLCTEPTAIRVTKATRLQDMSVRGQVLMRDKTQTDKELGPLGTEEELEDVNSHGGWENNFEVF